MNRLLACLLLLALSGAVPGQTVIHSPLGAIVDEGEGLKLPDSLKSAFPKGTVVRYLQETHLSPEGEIMAVYETPKDVEPFMHIAAIKDGKRVAEFTLNQFFVEPGSEEDDFDAGASFVQAAAFPTPDGNQALMIAYCNYGDGAASFLVLVTWHDGQYRSPWHFNGTQSQFRALPRGRFQVWNGIFGSCVWCSEYYDLNQYRWKNGSLELVTTWSTEHTYDPSSLSDHPIRVISEKKAPASTRHRKAKR